MNPDTGSSDLKAQIAKAYRGVPPEHIILCRSPLSAYLTRSVFLEFIQGQFPSFTSGHAPTEELRLPVLVRCLLHATWKSGDPGFRQWLEDSVKHQAKLRAESSSLEGAKDVSCEVAERVWETVAALLNDRDLHGLEASVGAEVSARALIWTDEPTKTTFEDSIGPEPTELVYALKRFPHLRGAVDLRGLFNIGRYGPRHGRSIGFETSHRLSEYHTLVGTYYRRGSVWHRAREVGPSSSEKEQAVSVIGGCYYPHKVFCWVGEVPEKLILDDQMRPHKLDGPAVEYRDGWRLYADHGSRLTCGKFEGDQHWQEILGEQNPEIQRSMVARHGHRRFLKDLNARVVHEDDFGKLWKTENRIRFVSPRVLESGQLGAEYVGVGHAYGFDGFAFVEVINSTADSGGCFKDYFLRVPFEMQTAREAVAWTFEKHASEYAPGIET